MNVLVALFSVAMRPSLRVLDPIAAGQYGVVHHAEYRGVAAVAKRAQAALPRDSVLATNYFEAELEANSAISSADEDTRRHFCTCSSAA